MQSSTTSPTTWRSAGEPDDLAEAEAEQLRKARDRARLEAYVARVEACGAARLAAESAVAAAGWSITRRQGSGIGSTYFWIDAPGGAARYSLRISDHFAPEGAGWDDALRCRHEPPDVNIVVRRGEGGGYTFDLSPLLERLG